MNHKEKNFTSFEKVYEERHETWEEVKKNPQSFRVLSGERATGQLHLGHWVGSLRNRLDLLKAGLPIYSLVADYQTFFDRTHQEHLSDHIHSILLDYYALGLSPEAGVTWFRHSAIPQIHELFLCFLSLVSVSELERNPTVKEEKKISGQKSLSGLFLSYPIHQVADILCVKSNLIPVGQDQLPHIELVRKCAQRFNHRYETDLFSLPKPLVSETPKLLGLDGQKMSKSRNNSILLSDPPHEIQKKFKKAKTDSCSQITYDPENRPEISQMVYLLSLCQNQSIEKTLSHAFRGAGDLKAQTAEALIEVLKPYRETRDQILKEGGLPWIREQLLKCEEKVREESAETLQAVKRAMGFPNF